MTPTYDLKYIPKLEFLYTLFGFAGTVDRPQTDLTYGYDHLILKGGRGGGKSESVAQALILISRVVRTRILCTREIQNSMADSVFMMLTEWIDTMGMRSEFHITKTQIINKATGTDFIFMGMEYAVRSDSLKSLKGVGLVWYEEAQTATTASLEKLDPTIRINGRKIIYTMNPRTDNDAVLTFFKGKKKVKWVDINYPDNPFCPDVLLDQAEEMKVLDYDRWLHIWMGQPIPEDSSRIILPYSWLTQIVNLHERLPDENKIVEIDQYKLYGGFDVADGTTEAHDKNALTTRRSSVIESCEEWQIDQVYKSVKRINKRHSELGFNTLYYDATAIGVAAKSEFARIEEQVGKLPYEVYAFQGAKSPYGKNVVYSGEGVNKITNGAQFLNAKSQGWWNLRLRLENSMRLIRGEKIDRNDYYLSFSPEIDDLDSIFLEMSQATFEEDNSGKIKVDKDPALKEIEVDGKKKFRKSPNKADSIKYAFASDLHNGIQAHRPKVKKAEVF
jgi:phage terminase large subunit